MLRPNQHTPPHHFTNTPTLRHDYVLIRKAALKLMGRQACTEDFNDTVRAELEYQGVSKTAQNWVNVAREVLERLYVERGREPETLAEVA